MAHDQLEDHNRSRFTAFLLLLGMVIGFLLGFFLHDTLVDHHSMMRDIKSWYPR
jgi:hypothetical protein